MTESQRPSQVSYDDTYIDDIVEDVLRTMDHTAQPNENWDPAEPDTGRSRATYRIYNYIDRRGGLTRQADKMRPLTFWGNVTQILCQGAIAVGANKTFDN